MTTVNIYLNFDGNCEEAFNFYKSVFGGDFTYLGRFKDMPADSGEEVSAEDDEKIMHVSLPIGGDTVIMGSDTGGDWTPAYKQGNNFAISINTDSKENADKFFKELSAGGTVSMPMADTFWGDYYGMFTDKFGIGWMVSFAANPQK